MRVLSIVLGCFAILAACATPRTEVAPGQSAVPRTTPCDVRSLDPDGIVISATLPRPQRQLFAAAATVLREQGFVLASSDSGRGLIETLPRFTWPPGTEGESWHGTENPGVVISIEARAVASDSTAFSVGARAVCAVKGPSERVPSDSVGNTLRMITALRVANGVRTRLSGM